MVLSFPAKKNASTGVIVSISISSYYTNAPNFPKSFYETTLLFALTSPYNFDPGLSPNLYASTFKSVVFPHPLAPIIPTISFGRAYPLTLCSTSFIPWSLFDTWIY